AQQGGNQGQDEIQRLAEQEKPERKTVAAYDEEEQDGARNGRGQYIAEQHPLWSIGKMDYENQIEPDVDGQLEQAEKEEHARHLVHVQIVGEQDEKRVHPQRREAERDQFGVSGGTQQNPGYVGRAQVDQEHPGRGRGEYEPKGRAENLFPLLFRGAVVVELGICRAEAGHEKNEQHRLHAVEQFEYAVVGFGKVTGIDRQQQDAAGRNRHAAYEIGQGVGADFLKDFSHGRNGMGNSDQ